MTLARKELKQRQIWKKKEGKATVMFVWVEGWITGNCYAPPIEGELDNLAMVLGEGMAVARIGPLNPKWFIWGGDFNKEASERTESTAYQMMQSQGGEVIPMYQTTRWQTGK